MLPENYPATPPFCFQNRPWRIRRFLDPFWSPFHFLLASFGFLLVSFGSFLAPFWFSLTILIPFYIFGGSLLDVFGLRLAPACSLSAIFVFILQFSAPNIKSFEKSLFYKASEAAKHQFCIFVDLGNKLL